MATGVAPRELPVRQAVPAIEAPFGRRRDPRVLHVVVVRCFGRYKATGLILACTIHTTVRFDADAYRRGTMQHRTLLRRLVFFAAIFCVFAIMTLLAIMGEEESQ